MRSETNDCGEGGGPASVVARALCEAPVEGLLGAAQGKSDAGARARRAAIPVYGALDLGTNNCRLLVARPSRRGFLVIDAFSRIIRLGEGVLRSGHLSDAAMNRTVDALKICSDKMRRRGVSRSRLIATEACRIAANSGEFIDRVRRDTGLAIEIVSRETEAKLAVSGCASLIDRNCDWALVFDIGGGSSELIWLDLTKLDRPWRRSHLRPARSAELHRRLDVVAHRRGQPRRAPWRPRGRPRELRGNGVGRDAGARRFRRRAPVPQPHLQFLRAFPRHVRNRHHHRRHSLAAFPPTTATGSMAAGSARRMCASVTQQPHRHELCRARGAALHRPGARRSRARRLRHSRSLAQDMALPALARGRPGLARRHPRHADGRGRSRLLAAQPPWALAERSSGRTLEVHAGFGLGDLVSCSADRTRRTGKARAGALRQPHEDERRRGGDQRRPRRRPW